MAPGEETDSGMASLAASKDLTPEKAQTTDLGDNSDDEDIDETLAERLWGLTEMFPESVRNATHYTCVATNVAIKGIYSFLRNSSWVIFSTATLLFAPVIFESERAQMEEMQKQQQRQILLGPNAAMSGGGLGMSPPAR
jgi:import receptor subunit TOM22